MEEKIRNDLQEKVYIAIDLKSFYASVECVERQLDPLTTKLVVADPERTEKTICLAVSPALKAYGIPGRPRLFEVVAKVREMNRNRKKEEQITYIVAPPRMALYMEYSRRIYGIYLKYVAPEDIHVYSIDEVFIDISKYLQIYKMPVKDLVKTILQDILNTTGITATAGIGTNLYLCKVAMDIEAKHVEPDEDGVRIAYLDELLYRKNLWNHKPITDFWRVGSGYAARLAEIGLFTMGDVARCSVGKNGEFYNEDLLYKIFGINAELLIDHAWGYEPCTMEAIKTYKPETNSISSGQVLQNPYTFEKGRLIVQEMTDLLVLDLVDKGLVTDQMVLTIGYDIDNLKSGQGSNLYQGEVTVDRYGRKVPKHAHGTANLTKMTSSSRKIIEDVLRLYDAIVDANLLIRRVTLCANHVITEEEARQGQTYEQFNLFTDYEKRKEDEKREKEEEEREKKIQKTVLTMQKKFGKNAILKGMNLEEGATTIQRNEQIGGHRK